MYGVLLLPFHGEPSLVSSFPSRREFLEAMSLENTPSGWKKARLYERAVYEITSTAEIEAVLDEVSSTYPDSFENCALQIAQWIAMQTPNSDPREELSSE